MPQPSVHYVGILFDWLAQGDSQRFAAGCADDLVLAVRGIDPSTTYVSKSEIADWYLSLEALVGPSVRTQAEVIGTRGTKIIVLLRHEYVRDGNDFSFAMVHIVGVRDDQISTWQTYPLNLPDYASALGLERSIVPQLV